jgi:hypothetical protein
MKDSTLLLIAGAAALFLFMKKDNFGSSSGGGGGGGSGGAENPNPIPLDTPIITSRNSPTGGDVNRNWQPTTLQQNRAGFYKAYGDIMGLSQSDVAGMSQEQIERVGWTAFLRQDAVKGYEQQIANGADARAGAIEIQLAKTMQSPTGESAWYNPATGIWHTPVRY